MNDFIEICSCSPDELKELLVISRGLKKLYKSGQKDLCLQDKSLVMLFEKPSLRTRMSFEVAMNDLGGNGIYVKPTDIGGLIGEREPIKDMARVYDRYVDGIMARTFSHETLRELAHYADAPVINALSNWSHPCQAMADLMTVEEHFGSLEGLKLAFIGDGNNVARSLAFACLKLDMDMTVGSPEGYELDSESIDKVNQMRQGAVTQYKDPYEAVKDANVIYTDTWVSMGQEDEKEKRVKEFEGYQVNMELVKAAADGAKVMHCLPAYRGYEITDEVMESECSIIFDEAENRLHFQRGLLKKLLSK